MSDVVTKPLNELTLVEIDCALAIYLTQFNDSVVRVHSVDGKHCCKIATNIKTADYPFRPTTEYADGGPLANTYKVSSAWDEKKQLWFAKCEKEKESFICSHTEWLPAMMLVILKTHWGDVVTIPKL